MCISGGSHTSCLSIKKPVGDEMKKGHDRFFFIFGMTIIFLWTTAGLHHLYKQYWPIKIIEHHFTEAKVLNTDRKVRRGEYLEVEYHYTKLENIAGVISRMLVNDRIVPLTANECAVLPVGENQTKILRIYIPTNMFPGFYYLVTNIKYPITENRTESVNYRTEWFEVTE